MSFITEADRRILEDLLLKRKLLYLDAMRGHWPWTEVLTAGLRRTTVGTGVDIFVLEYGFNMHHRLLQEVDCTLTRDGQSCHRDDDFGGHGAFVLGILKRMAPLASLHFVKIDDMSTAMDAMNRILLKFEHAKESGERPKFVVNISVDYTNASLIQVRMDKLVEAGIHVVSAAGNYPNILI